MPLLKFRCKECGQIFDELVRLSEAESQRCPRCGGQTERAYEGACPPRSITQSKAGCERSCPGCCMH